MSLVPAPLRTTAVLATLGAAMLWGTTGTAQALGPDEASAVSVGALRIAVGAAVLLLLATRAPVAGFEAALAAPRLTAVSLLGGSLCVAAYQACFFFSVARTGVAVGTVVALGLAPVATGLLAMLLGERPDRRWALATAAAVGGIVLLVGGSVGPGARVDALGVAAAVGAGVSYAGFTTAARWLILHGVPGLRVMAAFFTAGAVLLSPALLFLDLSWVRTGRGVGMLLWLGVLATALAYVLFQRGLSGLSARTVATLSLAEPVTAALLGLLLLREPLTAASLAGIAVVIAGLAILAVPGRRSP